MKNYCNKEDGIDWILESATYCRHNAEAEEFAWKTTLRKWGNSAAVRIPASVIQALHLELNEVVDVRQEGRLIVIEPVQRTYDIEEMVSRISATNLHETVDFGPPVGKETW